MIAGMLKTRVASGETQLIATTHSPTLLNLMPTESLFVCRKKQGRTVIEPLSSLTLWRDEEVKQALDAEEEFPVSQRVLRGDFDE
jgi:predicted ATPase